MQPDSLFQKGLTCTVDIAGANRQDHIAGLREGAELLYGLAKELAGLDGTQLLADLYCSSGRILGRRQRSGQLYQRYRPIL